MLGFVLVACAAAEPWPTFRGGPAQAGVAADALPETPDLLWTYEAGEGIESTAAFVGEAVYVGTDGGRLLCLNAGDGSLKWEYAADGAITKTQPQEDILARVAEHLKGAL